MRFNSGLSESSWGTEPEDNLGKGPGTEDGYHACYWLRNAPDVPRFFRNLSPKLSINFSIMPRCEPIEDERIDFELLLLIPYMD